MDPRHPEPDACVSYGQTPGRAGTTIELRLRMPAARKESLQRLAEAVLADPEPVSSLWEHRRGDRPLARRSAALANGRHSTSRCAPCAKRMLSRHGCWACCAGRADRWARVTAVSLLNRAESWRPWRAYAAQHLWAAGGAAPKPNRGAHD